jgi:hypothetical protein
MEFEKQPFDIALARQVIIFHEGHSYPAASDLPQPLHKVGAKEAGAPCNENALGGQIAFHVFDRLCRFMD